MQALFNSICAELHLGGLTAEPAQLSGGYMHRMFSLFTTTGRYAVKLLNPEIMARPDARENYARAEAFEAQLEAAGLPILPAKVIGGRRMQCVNGQHLYVFDFFDGHALRDHEITPAHCAAMGDALARIHAIARRELAEPEDTGSPDWPRLTALLLQNPESRAEGADMHRALPMLIRATRAMEIASARLPLEEALCHNDMDSKNVLWQSNEFRVIDLECLGYANPEQELLDLAISWAGWPAEKARFRAFINGYRAAGGRLRTAPADLYDSRRNHLDWLAYNARRALADDPAERRIGREQIIETLGKLSSDQRNRNMILQWMEEN